jgi:hypothetical protein
MNLTSPEDYRATLEELNTGYNISLQEVVKLMPEYKMNLNEKIKLSFLKNENLFKKRRNEIINLKSNIETNSHSLQEEITKINMLTKLENEKYNLLNQQYNNLLNNNNAAKGMLFDTQLLYNQDYIGNIVLLFVLLFYGKMVYSKYY